MKKIVFYFITIVAFISCQDDVKFNNPSVQGLKDTVFWRAVDSQATLAANGSLTIQAYTATEVLTLKTTSTAVQTYTLGASDSKKATYVLTNADGTKVTFLTGFGLGNGQITITEYDAVNKTVSGTFKFNAVNSYSDPLDAASLNYSQGVFYKVPVSAL
ncbi:DUF6252 family protein [Flavobacterium restrictum]|uniref:Lipocalin-like domain-containing protein n=1 Tax=Flavobacterium restrictum TaxID=2594428 RepID=A0A553DUB6_9FLAO|nr:DUF6252 family protein [Flavobacterium restrictum]TRX36337.1 hypothetical protein FNW21_13600 [Flavobacterium restrictum]